MRLHLVSLPHTMTTKAYSACAFTEKVRKMANMMTDRGHEVILYAGEENEARVAEHIMCISKAEQLKYADVHGPEDYLKAKFDLKLPHWELFNFNVLKAMETRVYPKELILCITGHPLEPLFHIPNTIPVEFGVGYEGIRFQGDNLYRVYESYAWMQTLYGRYYGANGSQGAFYDRVIPNYFDLSDFDYQNKKDDPPYFLFMGRINEDKGWRIGYDVAKHLGIPYVMAGIQGGPIPDDVDYRGMVGPEERRVLLAGATATFVPSLYLEPFGGVAVESLISGTPAITTDWGAFPEYNTSGVTGYRCRNMAAFVQAGKACLDGTISSAACRERGEAFSLENIAPLYESYFEDLLALWTGGWDTLERQ